MHNSNWAKSNCLGIDTLRSIPQRRGSFQTCLFKLAFSGNQRLLNAKHHIICSQRHGLIACFLAASSGQSQGSLANATQRQRPSASPSANLA